MQVDIAITEEWITWQKEEHIPEMMATKLFTEFSLYKLLEQEESETITYVVQYSTASKDNYDKFLNQYAPGLRSKALLRWGSRFLAFRTLMELVQ